MIIGHSLADRDGVILAMDEKVADFLHRRCSDVVGRSYLELTHAADQAPNADQLSRLRADTGPCHIRKRYVRGDGAAVWVNLQVSRLGGRSPVGHLVGTFDIDNPENASRPYRLWQTARWLVDLYDRRGDRLGADLFSDHAWTMLMHIYLAEAEGRFVGRDSLARLMSLSYIVTDRWIAVLEGRGLLESCDNSGRYRQLSQAGFEKLENILSTFATDRTVPALSGAQG